MGNKFAVTIFLINFFILFIICEVMMYYIVLFQCNWPDEHENGNFVKAIIIADTHLLGPLRGHPLDKLRREWQMRRSFQTSVHYFQPDVIFFLGDLFDEGQHVNQKQFDQYVLRFQEMFYVDNTTVISLVGNHDVGFHYYMNALLIKRFRSIFNNTSVHLHRIKNVNFVTINSMAMQNDGCYFCNKAKEDIIQISKRLQCDKTEECGTSYLPYSRPIILQHFPTYRPSDKFCIERDDSDIEPFRENWEVLSKISTDFLGDMLEPRLIFSGHSHFYCKTINRLGIEEYTVASYSWRNNNNPSFVLAVINPYQHKVSICYLPKESTVYGIYIIGFLFNILFLLGRKKIRIAYLKHVSFLRQ